MSRSAASTFARRINSSGIDRVMLFVDMGFSVGLRQGWRAADKALFDRSLAPLERDRRVGAVSGRPLDQMPSPPGDGHPQGLTGVRPHPSQAVHNCQTPGDGFQSKSRVESGEPWWKMEILDG
ncbi:hypothetical protein MCHIJ_12380 [Mycolicibacterium chitae]|nr:hypothetical protein MCHIJ_12380 [Mycolicibacterium chitae]